MQYKPTFEMLVEEVEKRKRAMRFAAPLSVWVYQPGLRIYMREGWRPQHGNYVLANIEATTPGKGALTAFLDRYEPHYQFSVEQILNPRLIQYFERRGYVYESGVFPGSLCMIGPARK